ncbi:MAG: tetratricopeptide repeat protein [Bacteroidetes bacterium]|jgi:tetratricopeptide (TPR) repeat protein|nr:tetratricopeptide repeat protein [Bacteroidota bacterium]
MNKKLILLGAAGLIFMTAQSQTIKDALTLTDNEQYEFAQDAYKSLLQSEPNNGTYWFYLGENYWRSDKQDSAKYAYEKGLQVEPNNPINYVGIGKVKLEKGFNADARKDFDKALTMSGAKTSFTQSKVAESFIHTTNKDLAYAIKLLNNAIAVDKKNPELYIDLGDAYAEQNNGTLAAENYNKALDLDKTSVKAIVRKGQLYKRSTNYEGAAAEFHNAIKMNPDYAPAYRELAEADFKMRKLDDAKTAYKKYLELSKNNTTARMRYASFLFMSGDYADAQTEINQISKLDSSNIGMLRLSAYTAYETDDLPKAKMLMDKVFKSTIENQRTTMDYEYNGKILLKEGNDSLAAESFEKSYQMDTTRADVLSDLGGMYMKLKKFPEAVSAYARRVDNGKGLKSTDYFNLARAYYFNKDFNNADTMFAKVVELLPTWPNGILWRAQTNAQLDPDSKLGKAKPYYEQYVNVALADSANLDKYKSGLIESYKYLGGYYYLIDKNTELSKSYWRKVLDLAPDDKQAKQVMEGLNQKK